MRYSCASVALMAAMAFSPIALGKTGTANTTFHVIKKPGRDNAAASPPLVNTAPPCTATVCDQIKRYTDTEIIEATEYYYYPDGTCQFLDPGMWSSPNNIQPVDNGTPAGTVTFSVQQDTPPPNPYTGATCIGGGPYQYAVLHFTWNLHKNKTAVLGYGPTATFSSNWTGDFGSFFAETFQITVPVVRPIGETISFMGFTGIIGNGLVGQWLQTLKPPTTDPSFDFTGETVQESFMSSRGNCLSPPAAQVPLAGTTRPPSTFPVKNGPPGQWVDGVGFGDEADAACAVLYNYCYMPAGCFFSKLQETAIKSDADSGFTKYGGVNHLSATSYGRIITLVGNQQGVGLVSSGRESFEPLVPQPDQSHVTLINATVCKNLVLTNCK
jgi:hypothetical protein